MTMITSEANNTGEVRLLATTHDTGLIGVGEQKISGKWSAQLWDPQHVKEWAEDLVILCERQIKANVPKS